MTGVDLKCGMRNAECGMKNKFVTQRYAKKCKGPQRIFAEKQEVDE